MRERDAAPAGMSAQGEQLLACLSSHPHARSVLVPALPPGGSPSHAYLFHGPPGTGKRTVARAFAAVLLADGAPDPAAANERVARGSHPDLSWVTPSGAAEMLVADVDAPVVAAASHTPFESVRRVFVIESAHQLNEQAANRLLKTLEDPPSFVHLLLLTDRREEVLPTISSRCLHVRFDPLPSEEIAQRVLGDDRAFPDRAGGSSTDGELEQARACARLSLGDAGLAAHLATDEGRALRAAAEDYVRAALAGATEQRRWTELLDTAKAAGARAGGQSDQRLAAALQFAPASDRRRLEREAADARRRSERRARTIALARALRLIELWLRDLLCLAEDASELAHNTDRLEDLRQDAHACPGPRARAGIALVQDTRLRLDLNVSEELALEALAYRL